METETLESLSSTDKTESEDDRFSELSKNSQNQKKIPEYFKFLNEYKRDLLKLSNKSQEELLDFLDSFSVKLKQECKFLQRKNKRAFNAAKRILYILVAVKDLNRQYVFNSSYYHKIARIIAVYMDLVIRHSTSGTAEPHVISKRIETVLESHLKQNFDDDNRFIIESFMHMENLDVKYKEVLRELLERYLRKKKNQYEPQCLPFKLYLAYIILFRYWKQMEQAINLRKNIHDLCLAMIKPPIDLRTNKSYITYINAIPENEDATDHLLNRPINLTKQLQNYLQKIGFNEDKNENYHDLKIIYTDTSSSMNYNVIDESFGDLVSPNFNVPCTMTNMSISNNSTQSISMDNLDLTIENDERNFPTNTISEYPLTVKDEFTDKVSYIDLTEDEVDIDDFNDSTLEWLYNFADNAKRQAKIISRKSTNTNFIETIILDDDDDDNESKKSKLEENNLNTHEKSKNLDDLNKTKSNNELENAQNNLTSSLDIQKLTNDSSNSSVDKLNDNIVNKSKNTEQFSLQKSPNKPINYINEITNANNTADKTGFSLQTNKLINDNSVNNNNLISNNVLNINSEILNENCTGNNNLIKSNTKNNEESIKIINNISNVDNIDTIINVNSDSSKTNSSYKINDNVSTVTKDVNYPQVRKTYQTSKTNKLNKSYQCKERNNDLNRDYEYDPFSLNSENESIADTPVVFSMKPTLKPPFLYSHNDIQSNLINKNINPVSTINEKRNTSNIIDNSIKHDNNKETNPKHSKDLQDLLAEWSSQKEGSSNIINKEIRKDHQNNSLNETTGILMRISSTNVSNNETKQNAPKTADSHIQIKEPIYRYNCKTLNFQNRVKFVDTNETKSHISIKSNTEKSIVKETKPINDLFYHENSHTWVPKLYTNLINKCYICLKPLQSYECCDKNKRSSKLSQIRRMSNSPITNYGEYNLKRINKNPRTRLNSCSSNVLNVHDNLDIRLNEISKEDTLIEYSDKIIQTDSEWNENYVEYVKSFDIILQKLNLEKYFEPTKENDHIDKTDTSITNNLSNEQEVNDEMNTEEIIEENKLTDTNNENDIIKNNCDIIDDVQYNSNVDETTIEKSDPESVFSESDRCKFNIHSSYSAGDDSSHISEVVHPPTSPILQYDLVSSPLTPVDEENYGNRTTIEEMTSNDFLQTQLNSDSLYFNCSTTKDDTVLMNEQNDELQTNTENIKTSQLPDEENNKNQEEIIENCESVKELQDINVEQDMTFSNTDNIIENSLSNTEDQLCNSDMNMVTEDTNELNRKELVNPEINISGSEDLSAANDIKLINKSEETSNVENKCLTTKISRKKNSKQNKTLLNQKESTQKDNLSLKRKSNRINKVIEKKQLLNNELDVFFKKKSSIILKASSCYDIITNNELESNTINIKSPENNGKSNNNINKIKEKSPKNKLKNNLNELSLTSMRITRANIKKETEILKSTIIQSLSECENVTSNLKNEKNVFDYVNNDENFTNLTNSKNDENSTSNEMNLINENKLNNCTVVVTETINENLNKTDLLTFDDVNDLNESNNNSSIQNKDDDNLIKTTNDDKIINSDYTSYSSSNDIIKQLENDVHRNDIGKYLQDNNIYNLHEKSSESDRNLFNDDTHSYTSEEIPSPPFESVSRDIKMVYDNQRNLLDERNIINGNVSPLYENVIDKKSFDSLEQESSISEMENVEKCVNDKFDENDKVIFSDDNDVYDDITGLKCNNNDNNKYDTQITSSSSNHVTSSNYLLPVKKKSIKKINKFRNDTTDTVVSSTTLPNNHTLNLDNTDIYCGTNNSGLLHNYTMDFDQYYTNSMNLLTKKRGRPRNTKIKLENSLNVNNLIQYGAMQEDFPTSSSSPTHIDHNLYIKEYNLPPQRHCSRRPKLITTVKNNSFNLNKTKNLLNKQTTSSSCCSKKTKKRQKNSSSHETTTPTRYVKVTYSSNKYAENTKTYANPVVKNVFVPPDIETLIINDSEETGSSDPISQSDGFES